MLCLCGAAAGPGAAVAPKLQSRCRLQTPDQHGAPTYSPLGMAARPQQAQHHSNCLITTAARSSVPQQRPAAAARRAAARHTPHQSLAAMHMDCQTGAAMHTCDTMASSSRCPPCCSSACGTCLDGSGPTATAGGLGRHQEARSALTLKLTWLLSTAAVNQPTQQHLHGCQCARHAHPGT